MVTDAEPSTPPPPEPAASPPAPSCVLVRSRRETFEYGLLPIAKLIFSDGAATLGPLKERLLRASPTSPRVGPTILSDSLGIPLDQSRLVFDTLAAVLPSDNSSAAATAAAGACAGASAGEGAHVDDLILFFYVQSYKRLLPKHKDSAAVADVWPTTSAFDGYLSALSPFQLARSNSRRFMPSQPDEEAHQLSYLQKHLGNILALLAEPTEGEGEESLVLTVESFEHLGLLIQFGEKGSEGVPLSQAAPFFSNSDPDMPAVPVPAAQVHDWLLQNIIASLEHTAEKFSVKENGPSAAFDADVTMADACLVQSKNQNKSQATFVEGISKSSMVKHASDINGNSVKVINCHDSVIYILAPLRYATIYGCSDTTIVLGAVGKSARVEHCERVHVIAATKRIRIANCRECVFYLGVNQGPLILGDNHKLQVAPYNTFYPQLEEHMAQVGVDAGFNQWDQPITLGMVDPHDSLSHPAGISDVQAESATCVDRDQFMNFIIPNWFGVESSGLTTQNPFVLPEAYKASQMKNLQVLNDLKQAMRDAQLEETKKRELATALHVYFKDWLYASGNIRQLYCLQGD